LADSYHASDRPTIEFARRLVEEALAQQEQILSTPARATASEICMSLVLFPSQNEGLTCTPAELIDRGNDHLRDPAPHMKRRNLLQARSDFSKALYYLQNDPSTTPKQVARICQKLFEATLGLSQVARIHEDRKEYAHQAQQYGEGALANAVKSGDVCIAAQAEFLLAIITAWKIYLQLKSEGVDVNISMERENVEILLLQRLHQLRQFPNVDIGKYEAQAKTFTGYLVRH
jgi:hypothetical protein